MSDLFFLRHGPAGERDDWKTTGESDDLRPLTEAGIATIQQVAAAMQKLSLSFSAIITSPLMRAKQTAQIVHAAYTDVPLIEETLLKPGMGVRALEKLRRQYKDYADMLLVGHEPDFSEVIQALIGGGRIEMKKGGLAYVRLTKEDKGELKWLLTPQVLATLDVGATATPAAN
ncbi:MAG: phosphohistidine phosphatase SixA [Anaerolineae bacterium]|nr:phosphohistidine phosphatase SixA [Anaerolineae bacterium]